MILINLINALITLLGVAAIFWVHEIAPFWVNFPAFVIILTAVTTVNQLVEGWLIEKFNP